MSDLVQRLSDGWHAVIVSVRPEPSVRALKACIDRGYVHVRFTHTQGGTELGLVIDPQQSDVSAADFDAETGRITVVGTLTLDYVKVRCTADIDLPALAGQGRLEAFAS